MKGERSKRHMYPGTSHDISGVPLSTSVKTQCLVSLSATHSLTAHSLTSSTVLTQSLTRSLNRSFGPSLRPSVRRSVGRSVGHSISWLYHWYFGTILCCKKNQTCECKAQYSSTLTTWFSVSWQSVSILLLTLSQSLSQCHSASTANDLFSNCQSSKSTETAWVMFAPAVRMTSNAKLCAR